MSQREENAESANYGKLSSLYENGNGNTGANPFSGLESNPQSPHLPSFGSAQDKPSPPPQPPVSLLVVGEPGRINALRSAVLADARFHLLASATNVEDLRSKLALEAEALLVEGTVFPGPESFVQTFATLDASVIVLLPQQVAHDITDSLRSVRCVVEVVQGEVNLAELCGRLYETVLLRRQARQSESGSQSLYSGYSSLPPASSTGWRSVAVWSLQGGVGKSTLSVALACEAAVRRLPTLLVGLGAPDPVPLTLSLKPEPNVASWRLTPNADHLKRSVQRIDALDVLAGFRDPLQLASYKNEALEGVGSLPSLAGAAAYAGYAVVIFDVSSQELAANTAVLVTQATLPGVLNIAEAVHLLNDQMAGRHRISKEAVHLVVNKVRNSTLTPQEVVKLGGTVRNDFPALTAYLPDDPQIEEALKLRRPAWNSSEPLRRVSRTLGDLLFAAPATLARQQDAQTGKPARVWTLGPLRIKAS